MSDDHAWFVKDSGFMEQVDPTDRDVFLNVCGERMYAPGDAIFRIGDPAERMHIIARGKVKLLRPTAGGQERIIAVCGPDDFIGEAFLRDADRYRLEAVAITEVVTCPIDREQFRTVARRAPGFALTFMDLLTTHLFHCREQMSASYDPVKIRVAKALLEQVARFGRQGPEPGRLVLETELKHEDIASLVSATRVAVTMALGELRDAGLVRGSRGHYEIDAQGLTELADGDTAA